MMDLLNELNQLELMLGLGDSNNTVKQAAEEVKPYPVSTELRKLATCLRKTEGCASITYGDLRAVLDV